MSFIHQEPEGDKSGAGKFVVIVLVVLAALGATAYWFLGQTPSPDAGESAATTQPAPAAEPEPEPEPEAATTSGDRDRDRRSTGSISIRASEPGAAIYLNDERVGEAPFERDEFPIGAYEVRVEKDGFQTFVDNIRIRPGRGAELYASLDLLPPSMRVVSDVPGATVFVDREYAGTTPVEIKNIAPGPHQLTVSAEGFDMHVETVELTTGAKEVRVNFQSKAETLNETIAVVHKHRFGSCEGVLVADATGLRYETSDDDAFQTAFGNLERFEIDYIDKNLNLKVRGGRNFNFTETSGNADALFVFHKDVQAFMDSM